VPIVAGITEMPRLLFQVANWSSAFLWAAVLLAPGKLGIGWLVEYLKSWS
jgi:membrane protein DedA with SNARE-associated domain